MYFNTEAYAKLYPRKTVNTSNVKAEDLAVDEEEEIEEEVIDEVEEGTEEDGAEDPAGAEEDGAGEEDA